MPTYQYRCLHCKAVQLLVHSMSSFIAPPCQECGGLTEKIIGQAPAVIRQRPDRDQPEAEPAHTCGSACVMHQQQAKPVTLPEE
jgi:putative FmdB family regulatory protein